MKLDQVRCNNFTESAAVKVKQVAIETGHKVLATSNLQISGTVPFLISPPESYNLSYLAHLDSLILAAAVQW
jgi:hypothetical protein